jgi:folate-binding protein YgfZ
VSNPRAVPAPPGDADEGVPWHFGDPLREQRYLVDGRAAVDLSHRAVLTVTGPDRRSWLHSLTTQHLEALSGSSLALILSPHGHVEYELHLVDDGERTWIITEPKTASELVQYLESMKFMLRVEVADVSSDFGVVWEPSTDVDPKAPTWLVPREFRGAGETEAGSDRGGDASRYRIDAPEPLRGREVILARADIPARLELWPNRAGTWAWNALRIAAGMPRIGFETDHRTLPHEVGWVGPGVHLSKGCYRGQEAVARVHNLGRPPRRLAVFFLDGSVECLPRHGDEIMHDERVVGWIGSAAQHHEFGAIATGMVKRNVPTDADLIVHTAEGDVAAKQFT